MAFTSASLDLGSSAIFGITLPSNTRTSSGASPSPFSSDSAGCGGAQPTRQPLLVQSPSSSRSPVTQCSFVAEAQLRAEPQQQLRRVPPAKSRLFEHVVEAQQFDRALLSTIFKTAREMEQLEREQGGSDMLRGYLMATLFYEPSTRTRLSFESAMKRLGGEVLTTENAREFSSAAKGETLADTIRTVQGYADIIVLRHFESGSAAVAADVASVPVINAGDGPGQHPTQALLDLYTIEREIGGLEEGGKGIRVGLVGDLAHGRTARSLAYLLAKFPPGLVELVFVAPEVVKMKDDIKAHLSAHGVPWSESSDLLEAASECDVIYQTRIQKERFGERVGEYEAARGKYIVDWRVMAAMKKDSIVMHPLPRLDEITVDVDSDPRAAYFRQAKNGLYIRMALLKLLLIGE